MATSILGQGCVNVMVPSGAGGYVAWSGTAAVPNNTSFDNAPSFRAAWSGRNNIYIPSGDYYFAGSLNFNNPRTASTQVHFFGEPSAPPTLHLKANSGLAGEFLHVGGDTGASGTFNSFKWYLHDFNIIIETGNTGCTDAIVWMTAQEASLRNCNVTKVDGNGTCIRTGDNGGGTGGGGTTYQNVTCNHGTGRTWQIDSCAETVFRGCTSNGQFQYNGNGNAAFINCTFNRPGGSGLDATGGVYVTFINCTLTSTTTRNITIQYHLENSFGQTQFTSGNVFYNGSTTPISGTDARLSTLNNLGNVPDRGPMPTPTSACVTANTGMSQATIQSLINANAEIYFLPGTYNFATTLNFPQGKSIWGASTADWGTVLHFSGNPGCTVSGAGSGQGVNFVRIRLSQANTNTVCIWNGDPSSNLIDMSIAKDPAVTSTTPTLIVQTGGFYFEQSDPAIWEPQNYIPTFMQYNSQGPCWLVGIEPEHYTGSTFVCQNAANLIVIMMQFEFLVGQTPIPITNSKNIVINATWGGSGATTPDLIALDTASTGISFFGITISHMPQLRYNNQDWGTAGSDTTLLGFVIPGTADTTTPNPPTVSGTWPNGSQTVNLTWTPGAAVPGGTVTGYIVSRAIGAGTFSVIAPNVQTTSYSDAAISSNTTYNYKVQANDSISGHASAFSNTVTVVVGTVPQPAFVQGTIAPVPTTAVTTLSATFQNAQTAGNSNVVAVSFNSITATVTVADSQGHNYAVVSPLTRSASDSQAIFYFSGVAAGSNTITVTFTGGTSSAFVSLRIAEFRGIGVMDVHSEGTGNGTTSSVNPVNTTNANDVIVVAANTGSVVSGPFDTGFIEPPGMNANPFGSDLQYAQPAALKTNLTAPTGLSGAANWVENLVAFLPAGSSVSPTVTTNAASAITTTAATLNGTLNSTGGSAVTSDGFDWGLTTAYGTSVLASTVQTGAFSANITGLSVNTTYHYRAKGTNAIGTGLGSDQQFTTSGGTVQIPTLVQHVATAANQNAPDDGLGTGNPGNPFFFNLPNPTLAGNCLILEVSALNLTAPTSITPSIFGTPVKSVNNGSMSTWVYVALNVSSGVQNLVITFNQNTYNAHFKCSEFNNVAAANALDQTTALNAAGNPNVSAGTMTTTSAGDLIWQTGFATNPSPYTGTPLTLTHIASVGSFTLLSVDLQMGTFSQYQIQSSAGAITPQATLTGSTQIFNSVAIALKASSSPQGSPLPAGIRIVHLQHTYMFRGIATQFPSSGNLIYLVTAFDHNGNLPNVTTPTGWTPIPQGGTAQNNGATGFSIPLAYYLPNAATSPNFSFTLPGINGGTGGTSQASFLIYDIAGAATSPFDRIDSGSRGNSGTCTPTMPAGNYTIFNSTPSTSNGLVICMLAINAGSIRAGNVASQMMDTVYYTNNIGPDLMDNVDGYIHVYNATTATIGWNVTIVETQNPTFNCDEVWGAAVAFKAAPVVITDHYVRPTQQGTNDGSSWNNAWSVSSINWGNVSPGHTVWVAGGSYTGFIPAGANGATNNPITVKKVTAQDPVPVASPGYQTTFSSTNAVFSSGISLQNNSWFTWDGQADGGFTINVSAGSDAVSYVSPTALSHLTFSYISMIGTYNLTVSADYGFNLAPQAGTIDSILVDHCIMRGLCNCMRGQFWTNVTIQYCYMADIHTTPTTVARADHADLCYNYNSNGPVIWKYNYFNNSDTDGIFHEAFGDPNGGAINRWFYGNVFYNCAQHHTYYKGPDIYGPVRYYNNTFYCTHNDSTAGSIGGRDGDQPANLRAHYQTGTTVRNNIFYNVGNDLSGLANVTSDHNAYGPALVNGFGPPSETGSFTMPATPANTFIQVPADVEGEATVGTPLTGQNFRIKTAQITTYQTGLALSAVVGQTLNLDMDGTTRGAGGSWMIGAFDTTSAGDVTPPSNVASLTATTISGIQINLVWPTATDDSTPNASLVYPIERMSPGSVPPVNTFTQIAVAPGVASGNITFSDTGLQSGVAYSYRLRAKDQSGNLSTAYSPTGTATTTADTSRPSIPTGLTVASPTSHGFTVSWNASTDAVDASNTLHYVLQRQVTGVGSMQTVFTSGQNVLQFVDTLLQPLTSYSYQVESVDPHGNTSTAFSAPVSNTTLAGTAVPALVQTANSGSTGITGSTATVPFGSAQTAGNLNLVVVTYGNSSATTITPTVTSVNDSHGQTYSVARAFQSFVPNGVASALGQAVYLFNNVAAGADSVTVTLSGSVNFLAVSVFEYSGIDSVSPIDVTASAISTNAAAISSGAATTTASGDLIFGAISSWDGVASPGSGFTQRSSFFVDYAEDLVQSNPGSVTVTATDSGNHGWVAQLVALKAAVVSGSQSVTLSGIGTLEVFGVPTADPSGTVTLNGTGIASLNAFGNPTILAPFKLPLTGIPAPVAFVTPTTSGLWNDPAFTWNDPADPWNGSTAGLSVVAGGVVHLLLTSVPSAEAFGIATVKAPFVINLFGITSSEAFGIGTVNAPGFLFGVGIASAQAFGLDQLGVTGTVFVSGIGISTAEAFGSDSISPTGTASVHLVAIPSLEALGSDSVSQPPSQSISLIAIPSAEVFGLQTLGVSGTAFILGTGIPTAENFGTARQGFWDDTVITWNASDSFWDETTVSGHIVVRETGSAHVLLIGIPTAGAFGVDVITGAVSSSVAMIGVSSGEAFGIGTISNKATRLPMARIF